MNSMLLHIVTEEAWRQAQQADSYRPPSLAAEGFIHCSLPGQITATANRYYANRRDLLLLVIDANNVKTVLQFENTVGGTELFPHIYGPMPFDAVVAVTPYLPDAAGKFSDPEMPFSAESSFSSSTPD